MSTNHPTPSTTRSSHASISSMIRHTINTVLHVKQSRLKKKKNSRSKGRSAARTAVCLGLAGALCLGVAGSASAATPTPTSPTSQSSHPAHPPAPSTGHGGTVRPPLAATPGHPGQQIQQGYRITNDSSAILIYQSVSGHAKAPFTPGQTLLPGQSVVLEVGDSYTKDYTGDFYFQAYHPDGTNLGQLDIFIDNQAEAGSMKLNGTIQGGPNTTLTTNQSNGNNWRIVHEQNNELLDNGGGTWELSPGASVGGVSLGAVMQSVCQATGSKCVYTPSSETAGYSDPSVIASEFDNNPVNGEPERSDGTVGTETGWSTSQTNSYSVQASTGVNLFDVVSAGVNATYGVSYTTTQEFSTNSSANLWPQQTAEIQAQYPVYNAEGTLTAPLGHTSWGFQNANFTFPRTVPANNYGTAIQYQEVHVPGNVLPPIAPGVHN